MMETLSLTGDWQFRQLPGGEWLPGLVPGTVHTDLLRLNRIPDPYVGKQELAAHWVSESDWEYRRLFQMGSGLLDSQRVFLVAHGLDTLAEIQLNGQSLGATANMFRRFEWEIRSHLLPGDNEISVIFHSPITYIDRLERAVHLTCGLESIPGHTYLRKAAYQFGWDWAPTLPTMGIWRPLELIGYAQGRIVDAHLRQHHHNGRVQLSALTQVETWDPSPLSLTMKVTAPDGDHQQTSIPVEKGQALLEMEVPNPQLWWPNGYGDQPLYRVEINLEGADLLDRREYSIGLRQLELRQEPDPAGRSFTFVVNGTPIFAKGANWVPPDVFPTRVAPERLSALLESASAANQNMLRVWGGGYYPDDLFFDLCDRLGLLVWQDFMFACGVYPLGDPAFHANVEAEAVEAIRRLRHHACLALWCGNNEMEMGWMLWGWSKVEPEQNRVIYDRFFHTELPALCTREDPDHAYWPSSPSSGVPFQDPNGIRQGDAHYWDVWHGRLPFSAYKTQLPRFMSEFGFQSLPTFPTVEYYAPPEARSLDSPIMDFHQRSPPGNGLILAQMAGHFREPRDFPALVYLSQVLQAEGIRMGVEHWRRNKAVVSGTLYWQLDDCWPGSSWSSLDYFGRWKALHYAARRFYAPLLLSADRVDKSVTLTLVSDLPIPWEGAVEWSLETLTGEVLQADLKQVRIPPGEGQPVVQLKLHRQVTRSNEDEVVLVYRLLQKNQPLSEEVLPFVLDKQLRLIDPGLFAEIGSAGNQLEIKLTARALARYVQVSLEGADVVFSDNFFDLPAGRTRTITCPLPSGWDMQQAQHALRLYTLFDSFA